MMSVACRSVFALCGDLLVDAEVLFDRGDAFKGAIDFFAEAGDILELVSEIVEVAPDRF